MVDDARHSSRTQYPFRLECQHNFGGQLSQKDSRSLIMEMLIDPKEVCELCYESTHLTAERKERLSKKEKQLACFLCGGSDYTQCDKCFLDWKPHYSERCRDFPIWADADKPNLMVCALCIVNKEWELDIEDLLNRKEQEVVDKVQKCVNEHGQPEIHVLPVQSIFLFPRGTFTKM